ncbi:hypothetical protein KUTeg_015239 [Tegillarca granosa]|uniref:Reverse transcriptase domain-containing protein n=1 Tax=Tegillarca granosa TaxID=220873 RepID=A0ABQ9EUS9_TEGGR|nr:hypothetical protein KUTeg_015239 [Tegillarca granosa]
MLAQLGPGALAARLDIKSAFRLLPIHPSDIELIGFKIDNYYFIDKCLPFGCSISCSLFEKFSTFLQWLFIFRSRCDNIVHYLDDFILAGTADSNDCKHLMKCFTDICFEIGVPLAHDKTIGPTPVLVFLGLEINTIEMNVKIPFEKLNTLKQLLLCLLNKKKTTLKELQSVVSLLNFCTRAIPPARAFNRRFYDAMVGLSKPFHRIRINLQMKEDIQIWLTFLELFNGIVSYDTSKWISDFEINHFTDSAGGSKFGCSAIFGTHWSYIQWPRSWHNKPILKDVTFLELGNASSTIRTYISAIAYQCKIKNVNDVTQSFIIKKMLTGLRHIDKRIDTRMPITLDILENLLKFLPVICFSSYESVMFTALFTLAFSGFVRIGELVANSIRDQGHSLLNFNIRFVSFIKSLEIVIPHSKTDQSGLGYTFSGYHTDVLIMGSSLVKYAFVRASESSFGKNLELERQNISVLWQGKGGMKWSEVQCKIRHSLKFIDPPNFIILHCGGNDIGECKSKFIYEILLNTKVIWSQILPRLKWRHETTHAAVEKIRRRINSKIATFVLKNGGYYIRYPEIIEQNPRIQQALQRFMLSNIKVSPSSNESGPWLFNPVHSLR